MNKFETPKDKLQFSPLPEAQVLADRKLQATAFFAELRDDICTAFEALDTAKFTRKAWERDGGGGGVMSLMRGEVFEKVGVNISTVEGEFSAQFAKEIAGTKDSNSGFWASGISLVAHMKNPHVPAVHMNLRMICTGACWFGGANDINASLPRPNITQKFHDSLKEVCDKHNEDYYELYKDWCEKYFYLPNRKCDRGQGGIFYDYLDSGNWQADFDFTKNIGRNFLQIYPAIVKELYDCNYTDSDMQALLEYRGRYAEFNLLYDRGTRFGLQTGGNTEAILMSLPPMAAW